MTGRSSQVARGLNTIAANIVKNQDALAAYGITVQDSNGNLKSTYDVLSELKIKWDEMSDAEKVSLGMTLAGKNQYKVLASVMANFATATEASTTALNSSGSAAKENARYMESIEARVNAVSAAFQQMSVAVVDSDLVKGILDIVKGMAEFGATDFGAAVTQFVLLSGLSWGGLQLLGQSILPGIINSFRAFAALQSGTTLVELANGGSLLSAALGASLPYILAITAAIVGLVAIVKALKEAYDAANPSVEQASLNMKNAQEALKQTEDNYTKTTKKLEELNNTRFEDRTLEIEREIAELQALVEYYEQVKALRSGEAAEAVASYAKSVQREGFKLDSYTVTGQIANLDPEGIAVGVKYYEESFDTLTEAVYKTAAAVAEFNGEVVEVSNISTAQKELEKMGFVFSEQTKYVSDVTQEMDGYYVQLTRNNYLQESTVEKTKKLIDSTEEYATALEFLKKNGEKLTQEDEMFLSTRELLIRAYEREIEVIAESQGVTTEEYLARYEAAAALSTYAQALIDAANAYQIFKDRLSNTGDYDDSFKGFSSILKDVIGEFDAGQIGSQAFLTGLELLTGQTMTSAEAVEYMNTHLDTLKVLFGDAESGGTGLLTKLQELGYATLDSDGNLQIAITDFGKLASELGISEGALYSLTEALRIMGVDFEYNADDILSEISKLGEGIVDFGDTTTVNFEKYVEAAKAAGMSNDKIIAISEILSNVEGIELSGVAEGLALLAGNSEDASADADDLNSGLEDVGNNAGGIESASGAMGDLASNTSSAAESAASLAASLASVSSFKAPSLGNLISGLFGHAKGTSHAKEGLSLVNEEGPELIQSGEEAYIAGAGLPTVTQLHEGDIVYTAEETEKILNGKKINGSIQSHRFEESAGASVVSSGGGKEVTGIGIVGATVNISKTIADSLKKLTGGKKSTGGGNDSSSSSDTTEADIKAEFDAWLKAKKHALAMDEITEEEYYRDLEEMNDKYFKDKKEYQDEYWKYQEQIYSWEKKQEEERIKEAEKLAEELKKAYENEFTSWLKAQDHALAMDEITQEEYYLALEQMNNQYFKDKEEYQDEYWKYEEKIYSWRKKQADEEAKAQEQALKDQIELEKKLNDLAKAKASKVKVFQDGQFRYVSDREALAKAQEALAGYASGTTSAVGGLSLVGENGAEMRVLNKGDGILPSDVTKNLWSWGSISPNEFAKNGVENYNFDISNISLPNVNDANNFVKGLKAFALQYATQRGN